MNDDKKDRRYRFSRISRQMGIDELLSIIDFSAEEIEAIHEIRIGASKKIRDYTIKRLENYKTMRTK